MLSPIREQGTRSRCTDNADTIDLLVDLPVVEFETFLQSLGWGRGHFSLESQIKFDKDIAKTHNLRAISDALSINLRTCKVNSVHYI